MVVLNIIGPYANMVRYWEKGLSGNLLRRGIITLGGDLNFYFEMFGCVGSSNIGGSFN